MNLDAGGIQAHHIYLDLGDTHYFITIAVM